MASSILLQLHGTLGVLGWHLFRVTFRDDHFRDFVEPVPWAEQVGRMTRLY